MRECSMDTLAKKRISRICHITFETESFPGFRLYDTHDQHTIIAILVVAIYVILFY